MTDVSHAPWSSTTLPLHHSYSQFAEIAGRPSLQSVPNARIRARCNNNGAPGLLLNAESDEERETSTELPPGGGDGHHEQIGDLEPLARQRANEDRAVSQAPNIDRGNYPMPGHIEYAQDDNFIRVQPSVYVDYLSHDWKEEDIWAETIYFRSLTLNKHYWRVNVARPNADIDVLLLLDVSAGSFNNSFEVAQSLHGSAVEAAAGEEAEDTSGGADSHQQ